MVYHQDQPPQRHAAPEIHRDIGRHDAQIESLQRQVEQLHSDMGTMITQLQEIHRTLAEARGGWKTLMAAAGLASAVTALAVKALTWLPTLPGAK